MNTTNTTNTADVFEAYSKLKDCIASLSEIKARVCELIHIDCEMEKAFGTLMSFASKNGVTTGSLIEDLAKAKILHKIVDEIDDVIWFNMPADRDKREARLEEQKDEIVAAIEVKKTLCEDDEEGEEDDYLLESGGKPEAGMCDNCDGCVGHLLNNEHCKVCPGCSGLPRNENGKCNGDCNICSIHPTCDQGAVQSAYDQLIEIFAKEFEGAK